MGGPQLALPLVLFCPHTPNQLPVVAVVLSEWGHIAVLLVCCHLAH